MRTPKNRLQDLAQNLQRRQAQKQASDSQKQVPGQGQQRNSGKPSVETKTFDHNEPIDLRSSEQGQNPQTPPNVSVEAMAFDHNEPIELRYNQETGRYAPNAPTYAAAHAVEPNLDFGSEAFEVESFDADPVATAQSIALQPEEIADQSQDRSQPQPLQPEVVADQSPLPTKSAAPPIQAFSANSVVEPQSSTNQEVVTAEDFLEDLQAILKGEKTYDGTSQQVVDVSPQPIQHSPPEPSTAASSTSAPVEPSKQTSPHDVFDRMAQGLPPESSPAASPTPTYSDAHSVFDRMGKNMAFANSFDLGTITLEQRFDEFDRMLDAEEKDSQLLSTNQFRNTSNISKPQPDLQSDSLSYQLPNQISSALVNDKNILKRHEVYEEHKVDLNPDDSKPYDYAFIGRGSSIAYYINALGDALPTNSIVIGEQDPWQPSEHEKSRGPGYINHQLQLIAQWADQAPEYSLQYLDRLSFSEQNAKIINRVNNRVESGVNNIGLIANPKYKEGTEEPEKLFEITPQGLFKPYKAKKVIVGMGAGPHKGIGDKDVQKTIDTQWFEDKEYRNKYIIDMDKFMRAVINADKPGDGKVKNIIVHGANAGIDPVEAASKLGYEVTWLIRDTLPPFLEGQLLEYAPSIKPIKVTKVVIKGDGKTKPLNVSFTEVDKSEGTSIEVDYYVLALGQDINAPGAAGDVIDNDVLEDLEPIYDLNQVYSDKPYETVLGLQTPGNTKAKGLEIIGAAAFHLGKNVRHNYIERTKVNLGKYIGNLSNLDKDQEEKPTGDIKYLEDAAFNYLKVSILPHLVPYLVGDELSKYPSKALDTAVELRESIKKYDKFTPEEKQILEAVIAMFEDLAKAQDYFKPDSKVVDGMLNQVKYEAANVIISPQLTTVRASVGALVSVMPRYLQVQDAEVKRLLDNYKGLTEEQKKKIEDQTRVSFQNLKANFSGDNRTVLMVYATQKYPSISGEDAAYIVDQIIKHRNSKKPKEEGGGGFHPLGYNRFWEEHWEKQFRWANDKEDKSDNYKENKLNDDKKKEWEGQTQLMKNLEEEGRNEWHSTNKGILNLFLKKDYDDNLLKKHLSSLPLDMQSLLRNVYGDKRQEAWEFRQPAPMVEIVLEGILTPEQGQKVYEILNSIKSSG